MSVDPSVEADMGELESVAGRRTSYSHKSPIGRK
jgi:hypothetical protein